MLLRIPALMLLLSIVLSSASLLSDKGKDVFFLNDDPLYLAMDLLSTNRLEEAVYLASFSQKYIKESSEVSPRSIKDEAERKLNSNQYVLERFLAGAATGEANNTQELIGSLMLDIFVIGDVRDLLVQGYREYDTGNGDEVVMGLSAAGLILTLAPELSWVPALFKNFWRGKRFSKRFQKQVRNAIIDAGKTGDYRKLRKLLTDFSVVVDGLGAGPALAIMRNVKSADHLALLASLSKLAPMETYTLVSINGIKSLDKLSTSVAKQGGKSSLLKKVKVATRQNKIFGKAVRLLPTSWLVVAFTASLLLMFWIVFRGRWHR